MPKGPIFHFSCAFSGIITSGQFLLAKDSLARGNLSASMSRN